QQGGEGHISSIMLARVSRPALTAMALAAILLGGCGGGGKHRTTSTGKTTSTAQHKPAPKKQTCQKVKAPKPKGPQHLKAPDFKRELDPHKTWRAKFATSCGTFVVTLDVARAPKTATSFAYLAQRGFSDRL